MYAVGVTTDGKVVLAGVAKLYFESGVPPSILFDEINKRNAMPSWVYFYKECKDNGMTHKRIIHLLHEHVVQTYGKEFRDTVIDVLNNPITLKYIKERL
jgi:hypothetical protein